MKKTICILAILLCLCSCSSAGAKPKLLGISFRGELTYYNEEYVFDADLSGDKTLTLSMKEPKELEDLNITVTEEGMKADYKGLTYEANEATMPFSKVIQTFYLPLISLASNDTLLADKGGQINGEFSGEKCSLVISPTGLPQFFELKSKQLILNFYNTSIKEE